MLDLQATGKSLLQDPPGYNGTTEYILKRAESSPEALDLVQKTETMRARKMQEMSRGPGKQLMTNAFMMFMSGSGLHIFSIMMTGMALMAPIRGLMSTSAVFQPFENVDGLMRAKLTFVALNCVGLVFGLYKLHTMGLIPLQSSDWISLLITKQPVELLGVSI